MSVAVIVPWRGGDPDRERAWTWLAGWWAYEHPLWPVLEGIPPDGPWCKAAAVAAAVAMTDADVLVIADADVYVPGVGLAVDVVAGRPGVRPVRWAMPHLRVYRLTAAGTDQLTATGAPPPPMRWDPPRGARPGLIRLIAESHRGEIGGGCVVLSRDLYDRVPLDPRFLGWGQEDVSWGHALTVVAGPPQRIAEPLWHLWHEPPRRLAPGETADPGGHVRRTRAVGSQAGLELYRRYRAATTPEAVAELVAEFREPPAN